VRKERDSELVEKHNRIKKLLLEEERTLRTIDQAKRKASYIADVMVNSSKEKESIKEAIIRDIALH
jgi:hypothetical protein